MKYFEAYIREIIPAEKPEELTSSGHGERTIVRRRDRKEIVGQLPDELVFVGVPHETLTGWESWDGSPVLFVATRDEHAALEAAWADKDAAETRIRALCGVS